MPELSIDPSDPGHESVGFDGAKNSAGFGINLVDLSIPILSNPESPFRPSQPRVAAIAGRRDGGKHSASPWIDLLNAILGDLKQVLAVESRSCMRGDIERALHLPTRRVESVQFVSRSKPDVLSVISDTMDSGGTWEGAILPNDFRV